MDILRLWIERAPTIVVPVVALLARRPIPSKRPLVGSSAEVLELVVLVSDPLLQDLHLELERGDRRQRLHIQGIAEFESSPAAKEAIVAGMKTAMGVMRGMKCKVDFNPFKTQKWDHMVGYIQKDEGKPHYRLYALGISGTELREGKRAYATAVRAPEQGRTLITRPLFLKQMYQARRARRRYQHLAKMRRRAPHRSTARSPVVAPQP